MKKLKPYQKVNKLPGSGFVTNKVNLATSEFPFIPQAFKVPNDTEKLKNHNLETFHPGTTDCTFGGGPSYSVFAKVNKTHKSQDILIFK